MSILYIFQKMQVKVIRKLKDFNNNQPENYMINGVSTVTNEEYLTKRNVDYD